MLHLDVTVKFGYLGFLLTPPFLQLHDKSVSKALNPNKVKPVVKLDKHMY